MASHQDLITAAYQELGMIDPIETLSAEMLAFGLQKMNRLLDRWNAQREAVYVTQFASHTLTANLNPHTIGLSTNSPTISVSVGRPVEIEAANMVVDDIRYPVAIRDKDWYEAIADRTVTSSIPTDLYYATGWPNGSIYLYPVPSAPNSLEIWTRVLLSQVTTVTDTFTLPYGYWDAIVRTLAEDLAPAFNVSVPGELSVKAAESRAVVFATNTLVPRLRTVDSGMPSSGAAGGFNWLTGQGGGR